MPRCAQVAMNGNPDLLLQGCAPAARWDVPPRLQCRIPEQSPANSICIAESRRPVKPQTRQSRQALFRTRKIHDFPGCARTSPRPILFSPGQAAGATPHSTAVRMDGGRETWGHFPQCPRQRRHRLPFLEFELVGTVAGADGDGQGSGPDLLEEVLDLLRVANICHSAEQEKPSLGGFSCSQMKV